MVLLLMALSTISRTLVASAVISFVCISIFLWMTTPGLELVRQLSFPWYVLIPASTIILASFVQILFIIFFLKYRSHRLVLLSQSPSSWANNLIDNIVFFWVVANDIYDSHSLVYLFISSSTLICLLSSFSVVKLTKFRLLDLFVSFVCPKFLIYFFKKKMIGLFIAVGLLSAVLICVRNDSGGDLMCFLANNSLKLKEISTTIFTKSKNLVTILRCFMTWIFTRKGKDGPPCQDAVADGVKDLADGGCHEGATSSRCCRQCGDGTKGVTVDMTTPVVVAGYGEAITAAECLDGVTILADPGSNEEAILGGPMPGYINTPILDPRSAECLGGVTILADAGCNGEVIRRGSKLRDGTVKDMADVTTPVVGAHSAKCLDGVTILADAVCNEEANLGGPMPGDGTVKDMADVNTPVVDSLSAECLDGVTTLADAGCNRAVIRRGLKLGDGTVKDMADVTTPVVDAHSADCLDGVTILADAACNEEAILGSPIPPDGTVKDMVDVNTPVDPCSAECLDGVTILVDAGCNGEVIRRGPKPGDGTVKDMALVITSVVDAHSAECLDGLTILADTVCNGEVIRGGLKPGDGTVKDMAVVTTSVVDAHSAECLYGVTTLADASCNGEAIRGGPMRGDDTMRERSDRYDHPRHHH